MSNKNDRIIPDKDLFMVCEKGNPTAFREPPEGFYFRHCRPDEVDLWKAMQLEPPGTDNPHFAYMTEYYNKVYQKRESDFFANCLFICREDDTPVGSCFIWKAYGQVNTIHWFKVYKEYEGRGLGRALMTALIRDLKPEDFPICLHTHPTSFRAIKLYSDFGFGFITDPVIGFRNNDLEECLPILQQVMPEQDFSKLTMKRAPEILLQAALSTEVSEF